VRKFVPLQQPLQFSFSAYLYACIPIGHFSSIDIVFGYVI
jgi:hypothetical protein